MGIRLLQFLWWCAVFYLVAAQMRSVPGEPDYECKLHGEIQPYPADSCTRHVIYCNWPGQIYYPYTYYWELHENVCPEHTNITENLDCLTNGPCRDPPIQDGDPCPFGIYAQLDPHSKERTDYYWVCLWDTHTNERIYRKARCNPGYVFTERNGCEYDHDFWPNPSLSPPAVEGEECNIYFDYQRVLPDKKCPNASLVCLDIYEPGRLIWAALEGEPWTCPEGEVFDSNKSCAPKYLVIWKCK